MARLELLLPKGTATTWCVALTLNPKVASLTIVLKELMDTVSHLIQCVVEKETHSTGTNWELYLISVNRERLNIQAVDLIPNCNPNPSILTSQS